MAKFVFKNNAITTLSSSIGPGNTVATIAAGDLFPNPIFGAEQFCGTFIDAATGLVREVVYCTRRVGNEITMVRGREGTTPLSWAPGDIFAELWTAGQAEAFLQEGDLQSRNYAAGTGMPTIIANFSPPLTAHTEGLALLVKIKNGPNPGAANFNPNGLGPLPIVRRNGSALIGGELQDEDIATLIYDGVGSYRIAGIAPATTAAVDAGTDTQSGITPAQLAAQTAIAVSGAWGLTYQRSSSTQIAIAQGAIASDDHTVHMAGPALTKSIGALWSATTGLLDTGAIANDTPYYLFAIKNVSTAAVNYLSSLSRTAPTMPAGYTKKRLIGWFRTDIGATTVRAFHTYELPGGGLEFAWDTPPLDVNETDTLTTARRLDALTVPDGISVVATINVLIRASALLNAGLPETNALVANICCPDEADAPVDTNWNVAPLVNAGFGISGGGSEQAAHPQQLRIRTDTSRRIAARASIAPSGINTIYRVATSRFEMAR